MAMGALDHWEQLPRIESMRRPNMRADESKNPLKFGKVSKSLSRLQRHVETASTSDAAHVAIEQYRSRLSRALQLSTTPLRIAPNTRQDLDYIREETLARKLAAIDPAIFDDSDERLAAAEEFVTMFDNNAIVRTTTNDPSHKPKYIRHWWMEVTPRNYVESDFV